MEPSSAISAVVAGLTTAGGVLVFIWRFVLRHADRKLTQVADHETRLIRLEGKVINGDLVSLKETTQRIEGEVAAVRADLSYLTGRFESHNGWERSRAAQKGE